MDIYPGYTHGDHYNQCHTHNSPTTLSAGYQLPHQPAMITTHIYIFTIQWPNRDLDRDNPRYPLTHALHNYTRTLNIPFSQHSLANPRSTTAQQHVWYTRATTVYPHSVIQVDTPGTPRTCEYVNTMTCYDILQ